MINLPFNFQPESVAVKTGSYTIPAGKYAFVTANVVGNSTFTINGSTALQATLTTQTTHTSSNMKVETGSNYLFTSGTAPSSPIAANGYGNASFSETVSASFWLPTGAVVNGSGTWRATVTLYNEPT